MKILPVTPEEFKRRKEQSEDPEKLADIVIEALNKKLLLGKLSIKWPFSLNVEVFNIVGFRFTEAGWGGVDQIKTDDLMFKLIVKEKKCC